MNIFYFFSKTDVEIIKSCTKRTQIWQYTAGIWVVCSGIISFFSSLILISILSQNYIIGILLSSIFSLSIVIFSREIISSPEKKIVLLHIPYALIMGLVFSLPIEAYILEVNLNTTDIITIIKSMDDIKSKDNSIMVEMILFRVMIIMILFYPAYRRIFFHNEYLDYIRYRMALNVQKIRAVTEIFMDDILFNPKDSLDKDYADILIYTVEDMADTGDNAEDDNIIIPGVWNAQKFW